MPPSFEIMVVLIVAISCTAAVAIVKMALDYQREKHRLRPGKGSAGESLTSTELKALMQEAVEEANAPLRARLEALETEQQRLLAAPPEEPRLLR